MLSPPAPLRRRLAALFITARKREDLEEEAHSLSHTLNPEHLSSEPDLRSCSFGCAACVEPESHPPRLAVGPRAGVRSQPPDSGRCCRRRALPPLHHPPTLSRSADVFLSACTHGTAQSFAEIKFSVWATHLLLQPPPCFLFPSWPLPVQGPSNEFTVSFCPIFSGR